jgi:HEAT repeat protein
MDSLRRIAFSVILVLYACNAALGQAQDDIDPRRLSPEQLFDRWQNHEDDMARWIAWHALANKGRRGRSIVPRVMPLAQSKDAQTRAEALEILSTINGFDRAIQTANVKGLKDEDAAVRLVAAFNVLYYGNISDLAPAIEDNDLGIRSEVARELFYTGERAAPLAAAVAKRLSLESPQLRAQWIHVLQKMGPKAAVAYPSLLPFVKDASSDIRVAVCWALIRVNPDDKKTAESLMAFFHDPDSEVREAATRAIMETNASGDDVVSALRDVVRKDHGPTQVQAAAMLYKLTKDQRALDILVEGLEGDDRDKRNAAAISLCKIKTDSDVVIQALVKACSHDDVTSINAFFALGAVGRKGTLCLLKLLDSTDESLRSGAARQLHSLEGDALPTVAEISPYLVRNDPVLILAASAVAAKLGPKAKDCVPNLMSAMGRDELEVRIAALKALGAIGSDSSPAVEILVRSLKSTHAAEQVAAASALGAIGEKAKGASPALEEAMQSKVDDVRIAAAVAAWQVKRDPAAVRALHDLWKSQGSALAAAWLWRLERNEQAMEFIVDCFSYSPRTLECGVGWEVRHRGEDEAIRFFQESCNDPDKRIVKLSKQALKEIHPSLEP